MNSLEKWGLLLAVWLCSTVFAVAQNTDYKTQYEQARQQLDAGQNLQAFTILQKLVTQPNTAYAPYTAYFYAIAAQRTGRKEKAHDMLVQLIQKHPDWQMLPDARLWLAQLKIDRQEVNQAFYQLDLLKGTYLQAQANSYRQAFYSQVNRQQNFETLLGKYPDQGQAIAGAYINWLHAMPMDRQQPAKVDSLIATYKLDPVKYSLRGQLPTVQKDTFHVAVMLPLYTSQVTPRAIQGGGLKAIYHLLMGMRLAAKDLTAQQKPLVLHLYDVRRDTATLGQLLRNDGEAIQNMDLIVGPIFKDQVDYLKPFCFKHKINQWNPISYNSQLVQGNPYGYLFRPSYQRQAQVAAQYAKDSLSTNKHTYIFYTNTEKDSLLAHTYKELIEQDSFKVLRFEPITEETIRLPFDLLTETKEVEKKDRYGRIVYKDEEETEPEMEDELLILPDSIGHIFVATENKLLASLMISMVDTRQDQLPVIGQEDWLDNKNISIEQVERIGMRFIAPNYIDYQQWPAQQLKENYIKAYTTVPTTYSYLGYDLMYFVGQQLHTNGRYFQQVLEQGKPMAGTVFPHYRFNSTRINQVVPIIQFSNLELLPVYGMPNK